MAALSRRFVLFVVAACIGCSDDPDSPPNDSASTPDAVAAGARLRNPLPVDETFAAVTDDGYFSVTLESAERPVVMRRVHRWVLEVRDADGRPVDRATIRFDGGMPSHDHGFPTAPRVSALDVPGRFAIDGVKFSMSGEWRMEIAIAAEGRFDAVAFDMRVDSSPGWSDRQRADIASLWIGYLGPVRPDPSNRVADDPRAAALGERFFFDARLSANRQVACATCHRPERHFADDKAVSTGIAATKRNTPTLQGSGYQHWYYWDGRRDSQWAQALSPLEHPDEHGFSRTQVAALVVDDAAYRDGYEALFGELEDASRLVDLPVAMPGGPVDVRRAWFALPENRRALVDTVFANIGKTLAAYGRTLTPGPSRFDAYAAALVAGETPDGDARLSTHELAGLKIFVSDRAQCLRCHNGPLMTNGEFHNIGLEIRGGLNPDVGRAAGVREVRADPFNCLGAHSDARPDQCTGLNFLRGRGDELPGAFKVPTLRNVAETSPYMHDGRFATLEAVLAHYANPPLDVLGHQEVEPTGLTADDIAALAAFLRALTATGGDK